MFTRCLLITVCFCSLAPSVHADATADARKGVQASLDSLVAAEKKNNNVSMPSNVYAPDYTDTDAKGHVSTLKDMQKLIGKLKESQQAIHLHIAIHSARATIQTFSLQGDTATVTFKQDMAMTVSAPKFPHPITQNASSVTKSIWKKYGDHWLMERRLASNAAISKQTITGGTPKTGGTATTSSTPMMNVLNGRTGLSTNIASEVGSSEKVATQFFHDVSTGNLAAAKAAVTPSPHRVDAVADVAGYVKTHGAITNVAFAFADTRIVGRAGLLCELTFADNSKRECQLTLGKRIPNSPPIKVYKPLTDQQKHDILTKGKWYVSDIIFSN